ncbi:Cadherin-23 [Armadillidium nasatum]|uniref:Cadherin-23 n=1 Tax=Armadillidium nasatum TaxID=96803 RepID=A0A5N5SXF9_9CRUS|nr:Cadherin-23 [Armadillidium nasatum]
MVGLRIFFIIFILPSLIVSQQQNRPPEFLPGGDMKEFALPEDTPEGSTVYTLKGRDPEGTDVTFSVSGDYLSVDRNSGVVSLVKPLDREQISSIETIITVTDGQIFGIEPNTVPIRLYIPILDVNDNKPEFRRTPYRFRVSEGVSPGATLFSEITIHDADAGKNAEVTLSCDAEQTPESCATFDVREAKIGEGNYMGVISLRKPLDYEKKTKYLLKLKAEDGGALMSRTSVEINVDDIQDQPPVLLNAPYSASVIEGSKPGLRILDILARDGDLGHPQTLKLSLEGDDSGYFALENIRNSEDETVNATLVTSSVTLDREDPIIVQNGGIYSFHIRADELSGRRESTRSKVVIVVTDQDDQKPFFNLAKAYVEVSENIANGTPLPGLNLIVSDEDVGENARFSLHLEGDHMTEKIREVFEVFPKEAVGRTPVIIKVKNGTALDFEDPLANKFLFKVVVSQNSEEISSSSVYVNVTDANDNAPMFPFPSYRFSVEEDAKAHTSIASVTANDSDSGSFGDVTYSIKGFGSEKFLVNSTSGAISVAPCGIRAACLDFEHQNLYSLTLSGTDGGGRVTSVNVFIDVLDVNDNPPSFDRVEYRRTVDEGASYFDPPLVVKASDVDGKEQGGGVVTYAIRQGNTDDRAFVIDSDTGEISITRPLSHLDTPSSIYTLTVRATDAGTPPKHSDIRVLITVGRDKNRPPRFSKQVYFAKISENSDPGTHVVTVKARDPDGSDSAIIYQMGSGGGDYFLLDEKTGEISVSKGAVLDRDVEQNFQLTVIALDGGQETQQSSSALVNISLTDINNKQPAFSKKSYVGHVNERSSEGEIILRVEASDPDENSLLSYSITEPIFAYDKTGVTVKENSPYKFADAFSVNASTGEIFVSGRLDHNEAAVIVFGILVVDLNANEDYPLQNDTSEVTIYVQIFSDKNPIFPPPWTPLRPYLKVSLKEEEPIDEKLFSVAAKDPVSGRAVRRYEKVADSDPQNIFSLDPLTGQVSLNSKLDYEESDNKERTFDVLAIAGDRTSQATVMVEIKDVNDHNPQFVENEYHTRLEEDVRWPKTVLQVSATDEDTGESGEVRYKLGGEDKLLFVINETSGKIQVARGAHLDRELTPTVNLEVTAYDTPSGGVNQRKTTVIVTIELIDVNDEVPIWSNGGHYTTVVPENTPIGTVVTQVEASDPDLGVNGLVTYRIPESQELDGLFDINSDTGVITVKSLLNGKGRSDPYELTVRALDQGTPQQFSEASVTLFIGDVSINDGVPVFIRPKPNEVATVMENSPDGTAVFQVKAIDADSSETANGKIVYSFLESPAKEGPFQIDSNTGLITTRGKLDREVREQHKVVVVAQDLGRPPQLKSRIIYINVTDADDNDPVFVKLSGKEWMELDIEEEAAAGTIVGYVKAVDRDIGENALIDYKIT